MNPHWLTAQIDEPLQPAAGQRQAGPQKFFNYFSVQVITLGISFGVQGNGAMQRRFLFPDHQDDDQ